MPSIVINYQPTEKQRIFHASKANEILYGGAAGGGQNEGPDHGCFVSLFEESRDNGCDFPKDLPGA